MEKILAYLEGKKTYIVAGLIAIATVLKTFSIITEEQLGAIVGLLAAFGLYSIRKAVEKLE